MNDNNHRVRSHDSLENHWKIYLMVCVRTAVVN